MNIFKLEYVEVGNLKGLMREIWEVVDDIGRSRAGIAWTPQRMHLRTIPYPRCFWNNIKLEYNYRDLPEGTVIEYKRGESKPFIDRITVKSERGYDNQAGKYIKYDQIDFIKVVAMPDNYQLNVIEEVPPKKKLCPTVSEATRWTKQQKRHNVTS